jgi:hypothetical protein
MPMPKAAVHENGYFVPGKYEVGSSGQILTVYPEPPPACPTTPHHHHAATAGSGASCSTARVS